MPRDAAGRPAAFLALLGGWAALSAPCLAHDLWIVPQPWSARSGEAVRLDVATGMEFPLSDAALAPDRVVRAVMHAADGSLDLPSPRVAGKVLRYEVRVGGLGLYRLGIETGPRFILLSAQEFEAYLREDGIPQAAEERRRLGETGEAGREFYTKHAQAFLRVAEVGTPAAAAGPGALDPARRSAGLRSACCLPLGQRIEIVPDADPTLLQVGESLGVRVLYAGQPAPGLQVRASCAADSAARPAALTDGEGRARIRIDRPGPWALMVIRMERRAERSQADWDSHWASLTFAVPAPSSAQ